MANLFKGVRITEAVNTLRVKPESVKYNIAPRPFTEWKHGNRR